MSFDTPHSAEDVPYAYIIILFENKSRTLSVFVEKIYKVWYNIRIGASFNAADDSL